MKKAFLFSFILFFCGMSNLLAQKPGMYVKDRFLYTAADEKIILKGFNSMIVYWDIHGDINFPEIEKTSANCCRIFWNLASPTPQPSDLDQVLGNCINHNMIPIICLWDATGKWEKLQDCVDYWCSASIAPILKKYERNLIVNIANEAGSNAVGDETFISTYSVAVSQMRDAGILTPIMIDADKWGRNADAVLNTGQTLLEQDSEHNLVFSWHLWDPQSWGTGTEAEINRIIDKAVEKNICFVVGEFGPCEQCDKCASTKINWEYMIEKAYQNGIGYLAWVWRWTDCHSCIQFNPGIYGDWTNSPWGEGIAISHQYSIKNTAVRPEGMLATASNLVPNSKFLEIYPNPFSDELSISIHLNQPADIDLSIYDIAGRKSTVIFDGKSFTSDQVVNWSSTNNLPKGAYFYRLVVEDKTKTRIESGKLIKL